MLQPAPLVGIDAAPVPAGGAAGWFTGEGGARLRAALFPVSGTARGSVVISPGRTEPIEKYFEVVDDLRARGFVVLVHDWRGQGLSARDLPDRLLGHADGYSHFMADYQRLLRCYAENLPRPWIALGHSMGGCLTLLALTLGEPRFSAVLLTAPMLGILTKPVPRTIAPPIAAMVKRLGLAGKAVFKSSTPPPFESNTLTHDRTRYERHLAQLAACPDLALGPPTWGWLDFAFSATRLLCGPDGARRLTLPVVMAMAGREHLVDNGATRRLAARMPSARLFEIDGSFHEILQETDAVRALFWRAFDELAAGL